MIWAWLASLFRGPARKRIPHDPFDAIYQDPLANYIDWQRPMPAEPRVVDHNWRNEVFEQLGYADLETRSDGNLAAHIFHAKDSPHFYVALARWPTNDQVHAGRAPMPITLHERRCPSIDAGLKWAKENYKTYANRARDTTP